MEAQSKKYNWLPDFVYGGIDGVVTTFAVVSGVQGASLSVEIILILGFANLFGDGFSMAVGKYLSDKAQVDQLENDKKDYSQVSPFKGSFFTFISFNLMGLIPLLGYILGPWLKFSELKTFVFTSIITLMSLFLIGVIKAQYVKKSKWYAGGQTMLIGGLAAFIAFYVGYFVEKLVH